MELTINSSLPVSGFMSLTVLGRCNKQPVSLDYCFSPVYAICLQHSRYRVGGK